MTPGEINIVKSLIALAWADGKMEQSESNVVEGLLLGFDASDEEEAEATQKRTKVCHLTQEMEKLLDIDAAAVASGAPEGGGLPSAQEEQRGREPGGGRLIAAAASGAPEGGGQPVAQEEQHGRELGGGLPGVQEPPMAGRWNEGDAAVSGAAHGGA